MSVASRTSAQLLSELVAEAPSGDNAARAKAVAPFVLEASQPDPDAEPADFLLAPMQMPIAAGVRCWSKASAIAGAMRATG